MPQNGNVYVLTVTPQDAEIWAATPWQLTLAGRATRGSHGGQKHVRRKAKRAESLKTSLVMPVHGWR